MLWTPWGDHIMIQCVYAATVCLLNIDVNLGVYFSGFCLPFFGAFIFLFTAEDQLLNDCA